jgi:hypothetical protein
MSSGCASVVTDPNSVAGGASVAVAQIQPLSSLIASAQMPTFDWSSMAMYPTIIGWGVLYTIGILALLFLGAFIRDATAVTNWWSTFVWSTLVVLLVMLAIINATYDSMLVNMHMCLSALTSFIEVAMSMLALVTIIMFYIMNKDFGTNQNVNSYIFIMLHVNLFCSLLNLCLVTMQKLSNTKIPSNITL